MPTRKPIHRRPLALHLLPKQIKLERLARGAIQNEIARANRNGDMYDQQRSLNELRELIGHSEFSYEEALEMVEAIESELDI